MKDAYVDFIRELQGTVRGRRQEKIREVELAWSATELAGFRLFVLGLHPSEMSDVCFALSDAQAIPLLEILGDFAEKDADLMKSAFQTIEKTSQLARIYLARRLIASSKWEVRAQTCKLLGNAGPQAEPLLERALADQVPKVQLAAVEAIAHGAFKKLEAKLFPLLHCTDKNLRYAALVALTRLGCASTLHHTDLLTILQDSLQEERTRRLAAGVLVRGASRKARSLLLEALRDPGAEHILRLAGAESLSGYDDLEAIKTVLQALDDPDDSIAKTARMSLSQKHSPTFGSILGQMLEGEDERTAILAAELLGGLETEIVQNTLLGQLAKERRVAVISALAQAMGNGNFRGAWDALIAKFRQAKTSTPDFFSALADVADEKNVQEFASLFHEATDSLSRRVIMDRLGLFAATSPVLPEVRNLAISVLNGPDETLHISAATVLAHIPELEGPYIKLVLERVSRLGDNPKTVRVINQLLRSNFGALADVFRHAPPSAAKLLVQVIPEATSIGQQAESFFRTVANWSRRGVPHAQEALHRMAFLAPATLIKSMKDCTDQIYLIEAWHTLPEAERAVHRPDFHTFFANATPEDTMTCIQILRSINDPRNLASVADIAFTTHEPAVRQAALELAREFILAPAYAGQA